MNDKNITNIPITPNIAACNTEGTLPKLSDKNKKAKSNNIIILTNISASARPLFNLLSLTFLENLEVDRVHFLICLNFIVVIPPKNSYI